MTSEATATRASTQPSAAQTLLAIGLAVIPVWLGLYLISTALISVIFGNLIALVFAALILAGMVAVVSVLNRQATGHRRLGAAICVSLAAVISIVLAVYSAGTIPVLWVAPGFDLAFPLSALACSVLLGAFFGPIWIRVIGVLMAIAIVGFWCVALVPDAPPAPEKPASFDEQFATYRQFHESTLVSDVPGSLILSLESFGSPAQISWIRTADAGVLEITIETAPPPENIAHVYPCWAIADSNMGLAETDAIEDYAAWCVPDGDGWARADGLGFARSIDGSFVTVRSVEETQIAYIGDHGGRPASATEVAAALEALRPITVDELKAAFLQTVGRDASAPAP